ncbi:HAD-IB family phosphatase [methane-oxidizing endosymbiont of Gigantopelta aegis]|uniref:HAD-IB family phosphatase n=1 Tax=methane-oxidizing endosymbiont of Gigantopelta aegis TaxID=2794938 RepID=UPI0018DC9EDD|nr:HAD-IB family phosphatase [methane-oxidizing endosymbiont of Gigantopelta aegis]
MSFDVICFDCDSTLSTVEGIDELARKSGAFDQVAALTNQAMNGEIALQEVYGKRLQLIKPDKQAIDWLAQLYIMQMVDDVDTVISRLQQAGKDIHIISGGIRQAILPLAEKLNIPAAKVHAVNIVFDDEGRYQGFDTQSPLARSGGKAEICKQLSADKKTAMIGDGNTDLEAKHAGAVVIGFGGVAARERVKQEADYFVDGPSLRPVLDLLMNKL